MSTSPNAKYIRVVILVYLDFFNVIEDIIVVI